MNRGCKKRIAQEAWQKDSQRSFLSRKEIWPVWVGIFLLFSMVVILPEVTQAQVLSKPDPTLAEAILDSVSSDVQKNYYDAKLHGLDWSALVRETKSEIVKAANISVLNIEIAALLERLDDSHTRYIPPRNSVSVDYGWHFKMFGDLALITEVKPDSDAAAKGLQVGDELLKVNGFAVNRADTPRINYAMNILMPMMSSQLALRKNSGQVI